MTHQDSVAAKANARELVLSRYLDEIEETVERARVTLSDGTEHGLEQRMDALRSVVDAKAMLRQLRGEARRNERL